MKPEQLRVHNVLLDTIRLLCKNSLPFSQSMRIEGVIGITTDSSDVFLVHINETLGTETSLSFMQQNTNPEPSFSGMAALGKRSHTDSEAPASQQKCHKVEKGLPCAKVANSSYRRNAAKQSKSNERDFDMPVLQKVETMKSVYSTETTSALETQSFSLGTNGGLQNDEDVYDEDTDQYELIEQPDYKTGEKQELWNAAYNSQHHNGNHLETPSTVAVVGRSKQTMRGRGQGGARVGKSGRGRAAKSVSNMGEQIAVSSGSESNQYVITQSTHVCGYPDCMKKFSFKQNLLQHQTKFHGRQPVKRNTQKKTSHSSLLNDQFGSGMGEGDCDNEGVDDSYSYEPYQ